ncbi:MAG: methyltransferase domain-containing protein [Planctomycetales bacterium]|nr:methyltransferase domain-containing protein [Planctomycetales bacterium]NIP67926.1 methyltransferase domain-containing protein [Planctomycetales bacterium]
MPVPKEVVEAAYQRHARNYDLAVKLYQLIGLRIEQYRARAIEGLHLLPGDCALDLGCGTGLSFPLLIERIGPEGQLIGVDLSTEMLAIARKRVEAAGWSNVQLVEADIAAYDFPANVRGVLSSGVFGYLKNTEHVFEKMQHALSPGGRLVIVDGKRPERWPGWLFQLFVRASSPFGLTEDYFDAPTWDLVQRFFHHAVREELYGGLLFIASGIAPSRPG